jgi:hypothetical protein
MVSGPANSAAHSFKTLGCMPSKPGDLSILVFFSSCKTSCSSISMLSSCFADVYLGAGVVCVVSCV